MAIKILEAPVNPVPSVVVYGPMGTGKTTFATTAPMPVVVPVENGVDYIRVARTEQPLTFAALLSTIDALSTEKFRTVVIDGLGDTAKLIHAHMLDTEGKGNKTVEAWGGGYGKWVQGAIDLGWRPLLARLDALKHKGITPVLIGHSKVGKSRNPEGEPWDRYSLAVNDAAAQVLGQWADELWFVNHDDTRGTNGRGVSGGRSISTQHTAAYDAKTRIGLPERITLYREHGWLPISIYADPEHAKKTLGNTTDLLTAYKAFRSAK